MHFNTKISFFLSGIVIYIFSIILGFFLFDDKMMSSIWIFGQLLAVLFFFGGIFLTYKAIINTNDKIFFRRLIWINVFFKFIILLYGYYYYEQTFGIPLFKRSDAFFYYKSALELANSFSNLEFNIFNVFPDLDFSDGGTIIYYGLIYYIFGDNIFIASLINLLLLVHSTVLLYKIIRMIDSEKVARLTAIIFSFVPIFNKYIAIHLKEIIFVWLILLTIYKIIKLFEHKKYSFLNIGLLAILIVSLFLFRTVVAYSIIVSIIIYLILNTSTVNARLLNIGVGLILLFFISGALIYSPVSEETNKYVENAEEGGNVYIERVSKQARGNNSIVVQFLGMPAQVLLTIAGPFPTIVNYEDEWGHRIVVRSLIADAYMKFLLGFLFIIAIFNKKILKNNYLITSFIIINIFILALSKYALNFRFHMPMFPFFIYFSVKGFERLNKNKTFLFVLYFFLILALYVAFNYNKLLELEQS